MSVVTRPASAQGYNVGDSVQCDGSQIGRFESGRVVAIIPRPGWPDPFYEVQPDHGGTSYKCLVKFMRSGGGAAAGVPAAPPGPAAQGVPAAPPASGAPAPNAPAPAADAASALCVSGTKVEAAVGITWYTATVTGPPTANGRCPVRRDNYDDITVAMDSLRPPGSGPAHTIPKPAGTPASPGQAAPDGVYACGQMTGMGTAMAAAGHVDVRGGVPTFRSGLPAGWMMRQIRYEGTDGRGRPKIVVDYTSKGGFNDRLDCFPE
ncbi:MAG: hypothetical protein AB7F22_34930 [Reyranella sp.]|uniref:hypothetical protein n=1 Tax=Reyranella sp. TaxID=1929291 RepID=UPI003D0CC7C0